MNLIYSIENYITYKNDPGKAFMDGVRLLTKDLGLRATP